MESPTDYHRELALCLEELISLKDVQRRIGDAGTVDEVLRILLRAISSVTRTREIILCLIDDGKTEFRVCRNPEKGHVLPFPNQNNLLDNDVIRWITRWGRPSTLPMGDARLKTIIPLIAQTKLVGVVYVDLQEEGEGVTRQVQEQLALLANQAASVLLAIRLRTQIETQLAAESRATDFLRNILESIHHGVITVNRERVVEQVNRNALALVDVPWGLDAIGKTLDQILPPDVLEVVDGIVKETLENGFALERRTSIHLGTGPKLDVAVSTSGFFGESGAMEGVVVILRDMTASQELERLRRIDQMKDEFVANVSHELRTPLTSIKAYTEALKDMVSDETAVKFLSVVDSESDRLIALIENLLDTSLISSGTLQLKLDLVFPPDLVTEVLHISKLQSAKHPITTEFASDLPMSLMDKARMKEVIINLIGNAIKYSPDGGAIHVAMKMVDQNLRIDISDRGMGIPRESRDKVFDRFYRVDSSLTYKVSGTGLGLAIVKKVVEAHDGAISCDENPGGGSIFTIILPIRSQKRPKFD